MNRFFRNSFLFCIPIILYCLAIMIIDPFNYFRVTGIVENWIKVKNNFHSSNTAMMGSMIWKLIDYDRNPCPNIVLGDSRAYHIDVKQLKDTESEEFYNLAVPGCNPKNIIDLFWYANERTTLKRVYIALAFHNYYGDPFHQDLFTEASLKINAIYPFFTDAFMIKHAYTAAKFQIEREANRKSAPTTSGADKKAKKKQKKKKPINLEKWKQKLKALNRRMIRALYQSNEYKELQDISEYCHEKNIQLVFIIFPNHNDIHDLITKNKLDSEVAQFKSDVKSLGEVFDYDYRNEITSNINLYDDPMHCIDSVYEILYSEVWQRDLPGIAHHHVPESIPIKNTE